MSKVVNTLNDKLLNVSRLYKSYNGGFTLRDISFSLKQGEIISIIGDNGSGKTTLAKLVTGIISPDKGKVSYKIKVGLNKYIGYAPENPILWQSLTTLEQIEILLSMYKLDINSLDFELYKVLQLEKIKNIQVSKLSNGNKKKLNFYLSVIHKPSLLVLDEPFNSLDFKTCEAVISWLIDYIKREDRGIIITTNRPDIANIFNKRVLGLEEGKATYQRGLDD